MTATTLLKKENTKGLQRNTKWNLLYSKYSKTQQEIARHKNRLKRPLYMRQKILKRLKRLEENKETTIRY